MAKTNKLFIFLSVVSVAVFAGIALFPAISFAGPYTSENAINELCKDPKTCPVSTPEKIFEILASVLRYAYTIFFIVAVIFILVAAFSFLTAKGDPNAIIGARSQIVWAVVAIVIALLSVGAAQIINNFLSNP